MPNFHNYCRNCGQANPQQGSLCDSCYAALEVPAGVRLFRMYAVGMIMIYGLVTLLGLLLTGILDFPTINLGYLPGFETLIPGNFFGTGLLCLLSAPGMMVLYLVAINMHRKSWLYGLHIACIALGLTSCFAVPICIPLFILYIRSGPKEYLSP